MAKPACKVVGIDHISIRVKDYERSKVFYGRLFEFLGFEISDEYPSTIGWTNGKTRYWIAPAEGRTQMTLVCSDRPGLLAQVAAILREHRLRVHDARIATFGERVEDFFQLTDESDQPLDEARSVEPDEIKSLTRGHS